MYKLVDTSLVPRPEPGNEARWTLNLSPLKYPRGESKNNLVPMQPGNEAGVRMVLDPYRCKELD